MEILSTTRPSFRVENYSREQSANNCFLQDYITDEVNTLPRSDGAHRILLRPFSFVMADGKKFDDYIKTLNMGGFLMK
ncbi:MAG: hypothetical protein ACMZI0_03675 [Symbiopectobacterium sp.]|uniref:hypothetical protein n=1 Tax=Symbiopectobacterium sp. TaxID=2952789 RepID=UPI0039EB96AC